MRPTINSKKHIVQIIGVVVSAGAIASIKLVDVTDPIVATDPTDVAQGAVIKAVYLEVWLNSNADSISQITGVLEKQIGPSVPMTFSESQALNLYLNKKNILYTTQGLVPGRLTQGVPFFRGWFKIPKGKQRFGVGDELVIRIASPVGATQVCGFATYKEYT